jgi:hypothetical protein
MPLSSLLPPPVPLPKGIRLKSTTLFSSRDPNPSIQYFTITQAIDQWLALGHHILIVSAHLPGSLTHSLSNRHNTRSKQDEPFVESRLLNDLILAHLMVT